MGKCVFGFYVFFCFFLSNHKYQFCSPVVLYVFLYFSLVYQQFCIKNSTFGEFDFPCELLFLLDICIQCVFLLSLNVFFVVVSVFFIQVVCFICFCVFFCHSSTVQNTKHMPWLIILSRRRKKHKNTLNTCLCDCLEATSLLYYVS